MSDQSYREIREFQKAKRHRNKQWSTDVLLKNGVCFRSCNNGYHLIVSTEKGVIDFFPSTGLFKGVSEGRGVYKLLIELRKIRGFEG